MKFAINAVLILMILGLVYLLVDSIQEPIEFQTEKERRSRVVIDKLQEIREAQRMHRDIRGVFANDFDSLIHVLRTDSFNLIALIGDPDDPTGA